MRARAAAWFALLSALAGPGSASGAAPESCPGDPIEPQQVLTGELDKTHEGSYVYLPFEVPAGTTALRVKYCHDQPERRLPQPETPTQVQQYHTLDLGLYEPVKAGRFWGPPEFRGWGGSSHPDVVLSAEGYSSEQAYLERPRSNVPGKTTRGFRPGPVPPGRWAVEIGAGSIVEADGGDANDSVGYRIEIDFSSDPAFADEPYRPAAYDASPARTAPGWYAGDLHLHAEHSNLNAATMTETLDFAFGPAGLDFVTLSDYVTDTGWAEIGRHQARYPGRLVVRSAEVITYRGHMTNHSSARYVDYRTGPLKERLRDGSIVERRGGRPPREVFDDIRAVRGLVQVNHPTIFPSSVPGFSALCRGCPWDYSGPETDWEQVEALEIQTGPGNLQSPEVGPNPFTLTAIAMWEELLASGHHIAAVGGSDSKRAGRVPDPTQAPAGEGQTVVYADELSEKGVQRAVERGRTYVKTIGSIAPDVRLEARPVGREEPAAIIGETVDAPRVALSGRVLRGQGTQLLVLRNGDVLQTMPVTGPDFRFELTGGPGRYWLQVLRGSTIETVTTPIWVGPRKRPVVRLDAPARIPVRAGRFGAGCEATGTDLRDCRMRVVMTPRRRRGRSRHLEIASGSALITGGRADVGAVLGRAGSRALRRRRRGLRATLHMSAVDRLGEVDTLGRRVTLVRKAVKKKKKRRPPRKSSGSR